MPKKKTAPVVIPQLWLIFNPESGLYFKAVLNNRRGRWSSVPHVYPSEKKLMIGLSYLLLERNIATMEPVVMPYNVEESCSIACKVYGE